MGEVFACWSNLEVVEDGTVPDWLLGAWVRRQRDFPGCVLGEVSDVVWLQVGAHFADIRLPRPGVDASHWLDAAHAFSGSLEVVGLVDFGAVVTWHHDFDTAEAHEGPPDSGHVAVVDDELVESGDHYVEWWAHPEGEADGLVLEHVGHDGVVDARIVAIGALAVAVWGGDGSGGLRAIRADAEGWQEAGVIGSIPDEVVIFDALVAATDGSRLPSGWLERSRS